MSTPKAAQNWLDEHYVKASVEPLNIVLSAYCEHTHETIRLLTVSLTECVSRLRQAASYNEAADPEACTWCGCLPATYSYDPEASHAADCQGVTAIQHAEALLAAVSDQ